MKMLGLNGLFGLLIAVVLVIAVVVILGIAGVKTQQKEARSYYTLDKNAIQMKSVDNALHYQLQKD